MNEDNEKILCNKFPTLFALSYLANEKGRLNRPIELFGLEVSDGWYNLIYNLCEKLEPIAASLEEKPAFVQIKSKFATLRAYLSCSTEEMDNLIDEAEKISARTCEYCGEPGKERGHAWISTMCDRCYKNSKKPRQIP